MVSQSVTMVSYYLSYKKDLKPHCWDEYFHSSIPKPLRLHSSGYSWDSSGLLSQNLHVKFDKLTVTVGKFLFTDTVPRSSLIGFNPIWPDISIPTIPRGGGEFGPLYFFFLLGPPWHPKYSCHNLLVTPCSSLPRLRVFLTDFLWVFDIFVKSYYNHLKI